jgi:hypothetical protein
MNFVQYFICLMDQVIFQGQLRQNSIAIGLLAPPASCQTHFLLIVDEHALPA